MKSILLIASLLFSPFFGYTQHQAKSSTFKNDSNMHAPDDQAIKTLLDTYQQALNASDTKAILDLYAADGVFMPSEAPTSIGKEAVEGSYNYVFSQIKLNVVFSIDEIEVQGELAFARTLSKGTTDILAAGISVPEENRELFVFKKENGQWKIARYMFNKMSPPQN